MKQKLIQSLLLIASFYFYSCSSVAPITNQYEKAGTLKKGNVELAGNFTAYTVTGGGGSESVNNNLGFRAGYGISDKVDIKFRYERLKPTEAIEENSAAMNYFSVIPKIALIPNTLSLLIPFSHYAAKGGKNSDGEETYNFNSIAPQLIYTLTNKKNTADVSFGLKADYLFSDGGGSALVGATIGAGFSSDLNKWAIRPEVGVLSFGGGVSFLSYGIGAQFILHKQKKSPTGN